MKFYGVFMNDKGDAESLIISDNYSLREVIEERHILDFENDKKKLQTTKTLKVFDSTMRLVAVL